MNETVRKSVRIHLRFIMTKVINRKRGKGDKHFSRRLQHSCFLFHGTEEVIDDAQDPFEKVDCINTYGSYNRTCKGDYVRPFQPCKDVNVNLTKTNISPLTAQVSRDTQETVIKRNLYHVNLYIDSTGRVSNCRNSNLKGPLGLLRSMLVQITLFFSIYFSILTYDRNYFHAVQIVNCHFNILPHYYSSSPDLHS